MSQERSRSKFSGVREKLLRFRRDYFCIRSGAGQRPDCTARSTRPSDVGSDSVQLPPLASRRAVGYRRSCDGGQPTTTNGDRSTAAEDGLLPRRHSVPSRCVAIPESLEEDDQLVVATPTNCRPAQNVHYAIVELMPAMDHALTDHDHADYDEFVRGLQTTTVTAATAIHLEQPVEAAADISARTVCRSRQRTVGVEGTATMCSLGRRTSEPSERRSIGGKLMRTLRKTFSLAGLGKNDDELEDDSLSADTAHSASSSFDKQSPYLPPLYTPSLDNLQSMQSMHRLDKDSDKLEQQQPLVS